MLKKYSYHVNSISKPTQFSFIQRMYVIYKQQGLCDNKMITDLCSFKRNRILHTVLGIGTSCQNVHWLASKTGYHVA